MQIASRFVLLVAVVVATHAGACSTNGAIGGEGATTGTGGTGTGGTGRDAAASTGGSTPPGEGTGGTSGVDADSPPGGPEVAAPADSGAADLGGVISAGDAPVGEGYGLAGPSRCSTAGVALCESFENGLDATTWRTTASGDGTAVVDELHAARGSKALHVRTGGTGHAYITERITFPATSRNLYARMFLWLQDDITTQGHFSIAEGAGTGTPAAIRFGGQFKSFGVGTDRGASGDWTDRDNKVVPSQKWMCVEFQFKADTHEFSVWWDDMERPALHVGPSRHNGFTMPTFTSLWFGWWMYNAQEPQDLWIDEIAIDAKPIGCAK